MALTNPSHNGEGQSSASPPLYRIEFCRVLGYSQDPDGRIETLEPYARELLKGDVEGELHLVDQATGAVVAHRPIWLPGHTPPFGEESDPWWSSHESHETVGLPAQPVLDDGEDGSADAEDPPIE